MELTTPIGTGYQKSQENQKPLYQSKLVSKIMQGRRHDTSKLTFLDVDPPSEHSHKNSNRKMQCIKEPTTPISYFPNGHKSNDPVKKWSRNNIALTMEYFEPISSTSSPLRRLSYGSQSEYAYAYYEPGVAMCHSNVPITNGLSGPSLTSSPKSIRSLLSKPNNELDKSQRKSRHTYTTRYGTQENIYEDVSSMGTSLGLESSDPSLNEQNGSEFEDILHNHYRVLEELNLSVEELLLSTTTKTNILSPRRKRTSKSRVKVRNPETQTRHRKDFQSKLNQFVVGEDSGFSGSSSGASYIGNLRNYKTAITRSLRKSSKASSGCEMIQENKSVDFNVSDNSSIPMSNLFKNDKSLDSAKSCRFSFWNKR